jgi:Tol biopolymer transport system component
VRAVRLASPLAVLTAAALLAAPAGATRIAQRTLLVSSGASGDSQNQVVSDDGGSVAFDTNAPSLTGVHSRSTREVVVDDLEGGGRRVISETPDGSPANGKSTQPALSEDGFIVAYASTATNLFATDTNGHRDIFFRAGISRSGLASIGYDGSLANGDSSEPDISADGNVIVFTSKASNLVPGDTNNTSDVFVRYVNTGVTKRVSQRQDGTGGNGPSRAPAISPDGRYVSFYSEADNLVGGDRGDLPDVFEADLRTGRIIKVSVSSSGRAQDDAVEPPFVQVSDVSRGGRYVVFDSDADNLVRHDDRKHTDVFLRDTRRHRTVRISAARAGEANSDSVYPRITPDGRFVTFESFANNLFPLDSVGADSFLYDRQTGFTTLLDVDNHGRAAKGSRPQLLQRPGVSEDGNVAVFSTFFSLAGGDHNRSLDAYVRRTDPARARIRLHGDRYRISVDDPQADLFFCTFKSLSGFCPRSRTIGALPHGHYTLAVRPWGGGLRPGPVARVNFKR